MTDPRLAVTWWGHATATVELDGVRVLTDPVLTGRVAHLRRHTSTPGTDAAEADVVLVSHLHVDHLHPPSLARMTQHATVVVPTGGARLVERLPGSGPERLLEVAPGDRCRVAGLDVEVLPADHGGRRLPWSRHSGPALGFRVTGAAASFWFPGDTGPGVDLSTVSAVDLALVPVGGWGPSLGEDHLDPAQAAQALSEVGARWALPVHWGTFWPIGLDRFARDNHHRLFVTPGARFAAAVADASEVLLPAVGSRVVLR